MGTLNKTSAFWLVALLISASSWSACGDDEGSSDEPDAGEEAGRGGRGGRAGRGGGGSGGSGEDDDAGTAGSAGKAGSASTAGRGGSGGKSADGCYDGEPNQTNHYLNRCTDSECEPFDNQERLPLLDGDKLPSLP